MSLLAGLWQYVCAAALAVGLALGAWGMAKWDAGKIAGLRLRADRAESVAAVSQVNAVTAAKSEASCKAALAIATSAADSWATVATEASEKAAAARRAADLAAAEARRLAASHTAPLPSGCEDAVAEAARRWGP